MDLGVVGGDRLTDALEDRGLAGLGRRDDQATLALADRGDEVDGAAGNGVLTVLHDEALVGVDGREVAKARTDLHLLGGAPVDRLDLLQRRELVVARLGRGERAGDVVARAQAKLADDLLVDEGVGVALHVVAGAEERVALVLEVENALDRAEALGLGRGDVDGLDEVLLAHARVLDAELGGLDAQLGDLHALELLARERGLDDVVLLVLAVAATAVATLSLGVVVLGAGLVEGVALATTSATALPLLARGALALLAALFAIGLGERGRRRAHGDGRRLRGLLDGAVEVVDALLGSGLGLGCLGALGATLAGGLSLVRSGAVLGSGVALCLGRALLGRLCLGRLVGRLRLGAPRATGLSGLGLVERELGLGLDVGTCVLFRHVGTFLDVW